MWGECVHESIRATIDNDAQDALLALVLLVSIPALAILLGEKSVTPPQPRPRPPVKVVTAMDGLPLAEHELLPALANIEGHVKADRLLTAGALLCRLKAGIEAHPTAPASKLAATKLGAWSDNLAVRYETLNKRLASLADAKSAPSWKCIFDRDGTRTFVKRDTQKKLLEVKCESELVGVRVEHFLATARETHLYNTWFPNTRRSETLLAPGRLERVLCAK